MREELINNIRKEIEKRYGKQPVTVSNIVEFSMDTQIISPAGARDFNIRKEFESLKAAGELTDKEARTELAEKHNLSDSTVYFILNPDKK